MKANETEFRRGDLVQTMRGHVGAITKVATWYWVKGVAGPVREENLVLLTRPRPHTTAKARRARGEIS
jgi:type IV secretory pathway protease TraF